MYVGGGLAKYTLKSELEPAAADLDPWILPGSQIKFTMQSGHSKWLATTTANQ